MPPLEAAPKPVMGPQEAPTKPASYLQLATKWGGVYKIPKAILLAFMRVESGFNPKAVGPPNTNGTRDYGLMQINNTNFASVGLDASSALVPDYNVEAACKLLVQMRKSLTDAGKYSDIALFSSYNEGAGRYIKSGVLNKLYVAKVYFWSTVYTTLYGKD